MDIKNTIYNDWKSIKKDIIYNTDHHLKDILNNKVESNNFSLDSDQNCKNIWEIIYGNTIAYDKIYNKVFYEKVNEWIQDYVKYMQRYMKTELINKYMYDVYEYYDEETKTYVGEYKVMQKYTSELDLGIEIEKIICKEIINYIIYQRDVNVL